MCLNNYAECFILMKHQKKQVRKRTCGQPKLIDKIEILKVDVLPKYGM